LNYLVNSDVSGDRIDEIVAQTLVGAWHLTKLFERVDDLKIAICMTRAVHARFRPTYRVVSTLRPQ
jgi:hypothetical protein